MVVGAKRGDRRLQFIVEALILSLKGGVAGIIIGVSGLKILSYIADWPTVVSLVPILLAFGLSGSIFFGFCPACKASLLDFIDALRCE